MKIRSCGLRHQVGQSLYEEVKIIRIFAGDHVKRPLVASENLTNDQPYLGTGARYEVISQCYSLIGSRLWAIDW